MKRVKKYAFDFFFNYYTSAPAKEKTTINYAKGVAHFEGWSDWRLHWSLLAVVTLALYVWLS